MPTTIDGHTFKNVAVADMHNVSGNFICGSFQGPIVGEAPVNPTQEGIIFFRWKNPTPAPGETRAAAELRYFDALNKTVGLDAVVVFGDYYHKDGKITGAGVKAMDPAIKVMHVVMGTGDKGYEAYADACPKYGYGGQEAKALQALLGLGARPSVKISTRATTEALFKKFPDLRKPENLANTIPSRPMGIGAMPAEAPRHGQS